jgi:hypothetical protein
MQKQTNLIAKVVLLSGVGASSKHNIASRCSMLDT